MTISVREAALRLVMRDVNQLFGTTKFETIISTERGGPNLDLYQVQVNVSGENAQIGFVLTTNGSKLHIGMYSNDLTQGFTVWPTTNAFDISRKGFSLDAAQTILDMTRDQEKQKEGLS